MPDEGFDFHTPPRREAKKFEPPPWEREAFEELERKRAEEKQAQEALEREAAEGQRKEGSESVPAEAEPAPAGQAAEGGAVAEVQGEALKAEPAPEPTLDEAQVTEMLAELSAQEPEDRRTLWNVTIGSAVLLGVIGAVLIMWSMAAIVGARRTGAVGWAGGFVLLVFGAGFVAGAWWLMVRTLRQRGVL